MAKQCEQCVKEFEGYGKVCGTCRSKKSRATGVATEPLNATENDATGVDATESVAKKLEGKNLSVPEEKPLTYPTGFCQRCGYKFTKEIYGDMFESLQTCYDCVASRNGIDRQKYPKH